MSTRKYDFDFLCAWIGNRTSQQRSSCKNANMINYRTNNNKNNNYDE